MFKPKPLKPQAPMSTYNNTHYSNAKTMAVEKNTGRIATQHGLNTRNADLEDHYFIQTPNNTWRDMGVYNASLKQR
jgi:hypothetical protein